MAVTKAQLVVWALLAGVSVGGYTILSRVKLPDTAVGPAPVAMAANAKPKAVVAPAEPAPPVETLPATIPQFPFPDDLVTATVAPQEPAPVAVPQAVASFADVPGEAIPQISPDSTEEIVVASATTTSMDEPAPAPAAAIEEPPIPMPSRPLAAQPAKTVPLSEVKTLYVVADALNVRGAPSTNGPVLQKLPLGFAVAAREQSNEWIGFEMRDGSTGWMRTDFLSEKMPAIAPAAPKSGDPLNLMM